MWRVGCVSSISKKSSPSGYAGWRLNKSHAYWQQRNVVIQLKFEYAAFSLTEIFFSCNSSSESPPCTVFGVIGTERLVSWVLRAYVESLQNKANDWINFLRWDSCMTFAMHHDKQKINKFLGSRLLFRSLIPTYCRTLQICFQTYWELHWTMGRGVVLIMIM